MKKLFLLAIVFLSSCISLSGGAWAAEFCVINATELQTALTTAQSNSENDTIKVVQGTYSGNFTYNSSEDYGIELQGGYAAACTGRVVNPINTILDGGHSGSVLSLNNSTSGAIQVDGFTIQNGASSYRGGGIYALSYTNSSVTSGNITVTNNIITGNTATNDGGGVIARSTSSSGTAGNVTLRNNVVTGNSSTGGFGGGVLAYSYSGSGAAGTVTLVNNIVAGNSTTASNRTGGGVYASSVSDAVSGSGGTVTLTNNTIAGNTAVAGGGGLYTYQDGNTLNYYNNIIRGNTAATGGADIYLGGTGTAYGYNNDYHEMLGIWSGGSDGNIDLDPQFVSSSNYHLSSISPCIDAGLNSAPAIPFADFEGHMRIIDGNNDGTATVDIGADEYYPCSNDPFKIGGTISSFASIHAAYEAMASDPMLMHEMEFREILILNMDKTVTLKGGYDCSFGTNAASFSTINGSLTISNGSVTLENIIIKQEQLLF